MLAYAGTARVAVLKSQAEFLEDVFNIRDFPAVKWEARVGDEYAAIRLPTRR